MDNEFDKDRVVNPNSNNINIKASSDVTIDGVSRIGTEAVSSDKTEYKNTAENIAAYNSMIKNKKEEVKEEIQYNEVSKGKIIFVGVFFLFIIVFVMFLPEIQNYFDGLINSTKNKEIINGKLVCKLDSTSSNFNLSYIQEIRFKNSLPTSLVYTKKIIGNGISDIKNLEDENKKCSNLSDTVKNVNGVRVECDLSNGEVTERQYIDYNNLDLDKVNAAYAEAGGFYPKIDSSKNINNIKKDIVAAGYSCNIVEDVK